MMTPLRILDTGLESASWNVAMTATLVELHRNLRIPDTLRFHRYPLCVLLGRSQDGCRVADTDFCRHESIEVVRRVTGGGAVFMSPRMLAWDVVVDRRFWGGGLADVSRGICGGIVRGLSHLGVIGLFRPPNAIVIGERKISGSSGYVEGRSVVLQGTLLISDEVPTMAKALRIPETVLRAQTTCLTSVLANPLSLDALKAVLSQGLTEALQRRPNIERASLEELSYCAALLREEIARDEFVPRPSAGAPI
jgi:lipoate---protein ligase